MPSTSRRAVARVSLLCCLGVALTLVLPSSAGAVGCNSRCSLGPTCFSCTFSLFDNNSLCVGSCSRCEEWSCEAGLGVEEITQEALRLALADPPDPAPTCRAEDAPSPAPGLAILAVRPLEARI